MADPGTKIEIPGAIGGSRRIVIADRYDHTKDPCRCANCGKISVFPWRGWASCESCCAVALVDAYGEWPAGTTFALIDEGEAA